MGLYNTYGKHHVQLKVADELTLEHIPEGHVADLPNGVYVGWDGVVVIYDDKVVATYDGVTTSHGRQIAAHNIMETP